MTHNTITHRHRLDKVNIHIPLLLMATAYSHRYVLYITDHDAVDECIEEWKSMASTVMANATAECLSTNAIHEKSPEDHCLNTLKQLYYRC
jgi:hypothetical protein